MDLEKNKQETSQEMPSGTGQSKGRGTPLYKKNPEVDPERYTGLFFALGLVIALSLVLAAFKWRSYEKKEIIKQKEMDEVFEVALEYIPPTVQLPPPPSAQMVEPEEPELVEVPDEKKIEEVVKIQEQDTPPVIAPPVTDVMPAVAPPPPLEPSGPVESFAVDNRAELMQELENIRIYVQKNVTYPREAKRRNIQGTVFVKFVLKKDGTIGNVEVLRGGELGDGILAEEVIRVLKGTSGWKPAKQRGRPVDVKLNMPISFVLK
ncbi:protein TonB [Thermonema lapsum]|uniref:Protein TonB n=1 Tax=Thermonema lapsum TaxID=28195 RepID=A0A846MQ26_9BACT|nr:energy transducer TonB [Thermonema lapsum]NIK73555.1 protein TonB [Thermonema lapsum]